MHFLISNKYLHIYVDEDLLMNYVLLVRRGVLTSPSETNSLIILYKTVIMSPKVMINVIVTGY